MSHAKGVPLHLARKSIWFGLFVVTLGLASVATAWACSSAYDFRVDRASAPPGTHVEGRGSAWTHGVPVRIFLHEEASGTETVVAEATPVPAGTSSRFVVGFEVPEAAAGMYYLIARQQVANEMHQSAAVPFEVTPASVPARDAAAPSDPAPAREPAGAAAPSGETTARDRATARPPVGSAPSLGAVEPATASAPATAPALDGVSTTERSGRSPLVGLVLPGVASAAALALLWAFARTARGLRGRAAPATASP